MKRIIALFCMPVALALMLSGCKSRSLQPEKPIDTVKDYIDFQEEVSEMDLTDAQSYLQGENLDVTTPEYRQAVYTVNENKVATIIEDANSRQEQTDAVTEVFEGIDFQFIDGEGLQSETVKHDLAKLGTFAWDEETQGYRFTFHDRTLAQTAVRVDLERGHALETYQEVLELLLSDPNVTVTILK